MNSRFRFLLVLALLVPASLQAADWPMWRCDAGRTASSGESLPEELHLQWVREYPPLKPAFWQVRQERVQFDLGYEPVVMGRTMFVASSRNDSVTALDAETGAEKWRFYADGPVRFAPVAWERKLYFSCDDGCLYCLDAASGKLLWKVRGAPSNRKALGNERLISVWPARGGPVLDGGRVYFAAGVWPFEGIFIHALDARTGRTLWVNDSMGSLYLVHPHGALSFGGPSPQGYLLINRGRLVVPSSRAFPAFLDPATGKLLSFDFGHGRQDSQTGGWFLSSDADGRLCVDPEIDAEMHDGGLQTVGQIGLRRQPGDTVRDNVTIGKESYRVKDGVAAMIRVGSRDFRFRDGFPGIEGTIHTMLAADGRLFVVTRTGSIYCFGKKQVQPARYATQTRAVEPGEDARALLQLSGQSEGYALVLGLGDGKLAEELAAQSKLRVVAVDRDAKKVAAFRQRLDAAGLYGENIAAHVGEPAAFGLPPYLANLIVCEEPSAAGENFLEAAFAALRPYGGTLCVKTTQLPREKIAKLAGAQLRHEGDWTLVVRAGPLPGAANYTGQPNFDALVRAPLGLLWFGDTFHHHKLFYKGVSTESGRGLPAYITVEDGVISYLVTEPYGAKPAAQSYADMLRKFNEQTHAAAFSDVYTGRMLKEGPKVTSKTVPAEPLPLARRNPITGREEAREYVKTYGCDLVGADYGNLITLRSGTAAFYDKRSESGTINISGLRSGCRNNMVPACGVLSVPSWTGNCTCNYPVFTSLALVPMPESFEQWSAWGGVAEDGPIQRVGINFGAPGDRMTRDGTLWLDWPSVGGPSPDVRVQVTPADAQPFYRHALWMKGGEGWPWVFASGIQGVRSVRIETTARATNAPSASFSARWTGFVQTDKSETNTFDILSDGTVRVWVEGFPIVDTSRLKLSAMPRKATGRLFLEAGRKYTLVVEYSHTTSDAQVELNWSSPSRTRAAIPSNCLFMPDGRRNGVAGVYFANTKPSGPALVQVDPQINFNWGRELPPLLRKSHQATATAERAYTVRLVFAEPEEIRAGQRVFDVKLQGREVLSSLDVLKQAGGPRRGIVREFRGIKATEALEIEFVARSSKPPLICGVELIAE
ncbi:MAG: PQQ-binding-like beta-propeller repeat protein [Verrucomicrobia bacterium]|nr:PQQ-binding-like beta-propeller repeat protein [Verrucomicrobiota bacterium]